MVTIVKKRKQGVVPTPEEQNKLVEEAAKKEATQKVSPLQDVSIRDREELNLARNKGITMQKTPAETLSDIEQQKSVLPIGENLPQGSFQNIGENMKGNLEGIGAIGGLKLSDKILSSPFAQAAAGKGTLDLEQAGQISNLTSQMKSLGLTPEQVSDDPIVQSYLRLGLNDLDIQNLEAGNAKVTAFQQLVETIPVVKRVEKYIGTSNTPSSKVDTILKSLNELSGQIESNVGFAQANPNLVNQYAKQNEKIKQEVLNGQSRIKLLTIQSPDLQSDPEQVILIQNQIQGLLTSINDAELQMTALRGF